MFETVNKSSQTLRRELELGVRSDVETYQLPHKNKQYVIAVSQGLGVES